MLADSRAVNDLNKRALLAEIPSKPELGHFDKSTKKLTSVFDKPKRSKNRRKNR